MSVASHQNAIPANGDSGRYDVVVMGGALSGAATAFLIKQKHPAARVLVVEKSPRFTRRVGEATIELSGFFLTRVLGLTAHLNQEHITKQGLRFWFHRDGEGSLADCSEIGGRYLSRSPSFLVDRAVMDEELLRRTVAMGVELRRPAVIKQVELHPGGLQTVTISESDRTERIQARWVVDASGVATTMSRQLGWWRANDAHPTAALWSRWRGVKDWDGMELAQKHPRWAGACWGTRGTATNHLVGDGWWAWMIQLKGGDVSIGLVVDERLAKLPDEGALSERLKPFLMRHPVGREILANAECVENDTHWRRRLAYRSTQLAQDGLMLVGDAAGFIDPLYSPGMDWIALTTWSSADLISRQLKGENPEAQLHKHNADFVRSYDRWFDAIYRNKYEYIGEFDLLRVAFRLDIANYYLGIAGRAYQRGEEFLAEPLYSQKLALPFYLLMRTYNRRLSQMAFARRQRAALGRTNTGHRLLVPGYSFGAASLIPLFKGLGEWAVLELTEGWRTWFSSQPSSEAAPGTTEVSARAAA